ncbi:MAG: rubredoxin [Lutibacter sp.]|jgi:rubredoxin|nr:rubredoxin [Lutibacter sp.]
MKPTLQRILIKGGVLSPSELRQIIVTVKSLGYTSIKFGSRQDILFPYKKKDKAISDLHPNLQSYHSEEKSVQNVVCSYVSSDIFPSTSWLKGSTYLYMLEQFRYQPALKINITDPKQRLVPLFNGELNFIASENEDYWYLYLNLPQWEEEARYPVLIYSWDIPAVAETIEQYYRETSDVSRLFELVNEKIQTNNRTIDTTLEIPFHPFPYYEGMNKMGPDKYWLGLYWRNNEYSISFLQEFCDFCLDCKVGKICITPWKSLIIKGIHKKYKLQLEKFLGKKGINIRHSSLELNWHLPVDDREALTLKKFLVRNFDQNDISTYGLTFSIEERTQKQSYFTAAVIEKNKQPAMVKDFAVRPTYNVLHCKNFDPNTRRYFIYAQDVDKMELPGLLMELSKLYFDRLGENKPSKKGLKKETVESVFEKDVHQCEACLTVYDPAYGDTKNGVPTGMPFQELPVDYTCAVCEAPKSSFRPLPSSFFSSK